MLKVKSNKIWHGHLQSLNHCCIILMYNMLNTALEKQTKVKTRFIQWVVRSEWVSWCFESCQPQRIISGLKTNFSLSPSYSFHKSLYRKFLFIKPQLKLYPQFGTQTQKSNNMFWNLFIFRGHSTREPASIIVGNDEQGDLFYSAGPHRNRC